LKISQRVAGVEYAIRDITLSAKKLEKQGQKITYLNIGDPVAYGFQPPENVKEALIRGIKNGQNFYAPQKGYKNSDKLLLQKKRQRVYQSLKMTLL